MNRICYSTEKKQDANNHTAKPKRVCNQKVIDKLLDIGTISDEQHLAAEQLASDYYYANFYKNLKSRSVITFSKEKNYKNNLEGMIAARKKFEAARAILTKEELKIVEFVVLSDRFLKYYNSLNGDSPIQLNLAYNTLMEALDSLAKYYSGRCTHIQINN